MSPSIIIHHAQDIESALVLTNFLQFHGFDASLDNGGHAALNWGIVPALGGIAVRLPRAQVDEVKELLRSALADAKADPEFAEHIQLRPDWQKRFLGWSMLGLYTGIIPISAALVVAMLLSWIPAGWFPEVPPRPPVSTYPFDYARLNNLPTPTKHEAEVLVFVALAIGAFLLGLERVTRPMPDEHVSDPE